MAGFAFLLAVMLEPERNLDEPFAHDRYTISYLGGCVSGPQCGQSLYGFLSGGVRAREFAGDWHVHALGNGRYEISWVEFCDQGAGSCGNVLVWTKDTDGQSFLTHVPRDSSVAKGKNWRLMRSGNAVRMAPGDGCSKDGVCRTLLGLEREYFKPNEPDKAAASNNLRLIDGTSAQAVPASWAFTPTKMDVADQTLATALLDITIKAQSLTGDFYDQLYFAFHDHSVPNMKFNGPAPNLAPSSYFLSFIEESERSISIPVQVRNCDRNPVNLQLALKRASKAQSPVAYLRTGERPRVLSEFSITPGDAPQRRTIDSEFGNYDITVNYQPPTGLPASRCGALPQMPLGLLFVATVLAGLIPALGWSVVSLYRNNGKRRRQITGWASAAFGGGIGLAQLDSRWRFLGFDIAMILIAGVLFLRELDGDGLFDYSAVFAGAALFAYALYVFYGLLSLGLRLVRRRLSPAILVLTAAVFGLVYVMVFIPLEKSGLDRDLKTALIFGTLVVALIASLVLVFRIWRNHRPTRRTLWLGLLFLLGGLLCDAVFTALLGAQVADRFALGLPLGDVTAVLVVVLAGALQYRHLENRWGPIVWPIVAIVSGLTLRFLLGATAALSDATGGGVSAGAGQLFIALLLGALAAEGLLLAKRIWIDRDPEARKRAIVIRGVFLILHAVTPILLFIFVIVSVFGFTARVGAELGDAGKELKIIQTSIDRIRNEAIAARGRAEGQVADVELQIQRLRESLKDKHKDALEEFDKIYEESVQATLNSGSAIADDLAREGEAIVSEVTSALTPPPLDLGLFKVPNPFSAIGDGIVSAISGLLPSIDFGAIVGQLSQRAVDTVTREFAGPLARAQSIVAGVESLGNEISAEARAQANELSRTATLALNVLNEELETSYKTAGRLMAVSIKIVYQIIVLSASILMALMLFLLWRVFNGMVEMGREIERGLGLIRGTETVDVDGPSA